MNVLIAEDDATLRVLLMTLLARKDIPCHLVNDGRGAVMAWEGGGFDLIFMDIQMPGMDGLEATRIIRERERGIDTHVPIIALTAHASLRDRELCRSVGMDDYIEKPFKFSEFYQMLDRYRPRI
ncbi:MAG: response regulator [Syntrophotaleaceae bacterium]